MKAREKIISIAVDEVLREGVGGARLNQILRQSELSKGAFYHYFASKDALLEALILEELAPQLQKVWIRPLSRSGRSWPDLKRVCLAEIHNISGAGGTFMELFATFIQGIEVLNPTQRQQLEALLESWQSTMKRVLRTARQANQIAGAIDERAVVWLLLGALQSGRQAALLQGKRLECRDVMATLLALIEG